MQTATNAFSKMVIDMFFIVNVRIFENNLENQII